MYEAVEFSSSGTTLRGRLYGGDNSNRPGIVMAHGTSATISMVADAYAEAIHKSGFSVLLYDHANFGDSDGTTVPPALGKSQLSVLQTTGMAPGLGRRCG